MRNHSARAVIVALLLSACGGPNAQGVLSETAANLRDIRSGVISLSLVAESTGDLAGTVGYELSGPFSLAEDGGLPVADLEYTQFAGAEQETVRFISTGEAAFIEVGGQSYVAPTEEGAPDDGAPQPGPPPLEELRIDRWISNPSIEDGGQVGGADTYRITADLDAVTALGDILSLSGSLGSTGVLAVFQGVGREHLERTVRSSRIDVFTGKDDRLLRRLVMDIRLGLSGIEGLEEAVEGLTGLQVVFELELSDIGREVSVTAPADALPASELPTSGS
jgi:hypothetical protein